MRGPRVALLHSRCSGPRWLRSGAWPRSQGCVGWIGCPHWGFAQMTLPEAMRSAQWSRSSRCCAPYPRAVGLGLLASRSR